MLVTVGVGGSNTGGNRNWWRTSSGQGSVSADSDVEISTGLTISRILWHSSDQLRFFRTGSGSFSLAVTASGSLGGKSFLIAVNDTDPPIDAQFDIDTASISTLSVRIGLNTNAAQTAAFNTVVTGGLVNIVISDVPGTGPPAVVHDIAASLTAGAPSITASADKEIPAAVFDTAAAAHGWRTGTLAASAEKVGLAQEFHDVAVAVTAGAPSRGGSSGGGGRRHSRGRSGDCCRAAERRRGCRVGRSDATLPRHGGSVRGWPPIGRYLG